MDKLENPDSGEGGRITEKTGNNFTQGSDKTSILPTIHIDNMDLILIHEVYRY